MGDHFCERESYAFPPFPEFLQKIITAGGLMNAMAGGDIV